MKSKTDDKPFYEQERGRWLCPDETTALETAEKHPGDFVYVYDRQDNGAITNIRKYWAPTDPDTNKLQGIKRGKVQWKT